MPHRAAQYLYTFLATGSVATAFLASVSGSLKAQTPHALYAVGEMPTEGISPAALSWLGFLASALVVLGKAYVDFRNKGRDADIADAREWGKQLGEAQSQIEVLTARLDASKTLFTETKQANEAKLADLKARNLELEARNKAQAADVAAMQDRLAQLIASQNKVITAVNKTQIKVKDTNKRVGELEQAVGSTSDLNLQPPKEDSTAIDLPNLR